MLENMKPTETKRPEQSIVYDEHFYGSFSEVAAFEANEFFDGDENYRKQQKKQFIAGEIQNPHLDLPSINIEEINNIEASLLAQKTDLLNNEQNEVIKQAYRWKLNEKIAEIRMIKSAIAGNGYRRFNRYSEFIYGKPSPDIFAYEINKIRTKAESHVNSDNEIVKSAAVDLLSYLPEINNPTTLKLPSKASVQYANQQTAQEMSDLINIESDETEFDSKAILDAFKNALQQIGDNEWVVVVDPNSSKTAVSVSQSNMEVIIPESRKVDQDKLKSLIIHEVGTHVARRENGERSKLKLLGLGLDRYLTAEEGISTMREQAYAGKVADFRGIDGHLAISLAKGLDGKPRDFRQVYQIMEKYYFFNNVTAKSKRTELESFEKAQDSAWKHCVRTFRGTDCATAGACFTKDIVYREGNIDIWALIENDPSSMMKFNIGKYNPSNNRHVWVLEQLGITDRDLVDLEA